MQKIYVFVICIFSLCTVNAQQTKTKGVFVVSSQAALLNGDSHVNGQLLLTAGYEQNGWMIGAGSGFDYYKYRTVPVFADVKKYFGKGNRQLFIYANAGSDLAWPTDNQKTNRAVWWGWGEPQASVFKNGVYTDLGFGYTLFNNKRSGFFTAIGYSTKTLTEVYDEPIWNGTNSVITKRTLKYTMNRSLLRIGYRF